MIDIGEALIYIAFTFIISFTIGYCAGNGLWVLWS